MMKKQITMTRPAVKSSGRNSSASRLFLLGFGFASGLLLSVLLQQPAISTDLVETRVASESPSTCPSITSLLASTFFSINPENGLIQLPDTVKTVLIDVGAREPSGFLDKIERDEDPSVAVFLFDPLPDSFIPLQKRAAAYSMRKREKPWLDPTKSHQVFAIRAAMGENEGITSFNVGTGPACSSILQSNSNNTFWCAKSSRSIQALVLQLVHVIALIPPSVDNIHIKVDAEGADLLVLKGAGSALSRVHTIIIECFGTEADQKTAVHQEGGCYQPEAEAYMKSVGFPTHSVEGQGSTQVNIFFENEKMKSKGLPKILKGMQVDPFNKFYPKMQFEA